MTTRRRMRTVAAVVCAGVVLVNAGASAAQTPTRDRVAPGAGAPVVRGTGVIAGRVVTDEETPRPVRRATVAVSAGLLASPVLTTTDDEGRFVVEDLPAGAYRVGAEKPGWVPTVYGTRAPGQVQGVPLVLADQQRVTDVELRMPRGAVITGQVRSTSGAPVAGASVEALRMGRSLAVSGLTSLPTTTDADGRYRIYGLAAGDYVVRSMSPVVAALTYRPVAPAEVRWADALLQQARSAPGAVNVGPAPDVPASSLLLPTYAPSSGDPAGAVTVRVRAGEERQGVDVDLQLVTASPVRGRVTRADGSPASQVTVTLARQGEEPMVRGLMDITAMVLGSGRAVTDTAGAFVIPSVPPGQYVVQARATARGEAPQWADAPVVATGAQVEGVALTLRDGLRVSGRVVFDGAPGQGASGATVQLSGLSNPLAALGLPGGISGMAAAMMTGSRPSTATVGADGRFEITGVVPGEYALSVLMPGLWTVLTEPGQGWVLASARLGDVEVADRGLDVRQGLDVTNLEIRMTNRPAVLTGRLLDGNGRPVTSLPLVAFSADPAHWQGTKRRVVSTNTDSTGRYFLAGLPPGDYLVAVVTDVDPSDLASPAFLEELRAMAIAVRLSEGEQKTQDVKVSGG